MKLSPRHNDVARVSVAAIMVMGPEGKVCEDARIVLGSVAPTVIRSPQSEQVLKGGAIDEDVVGEAAQAASETARPRSSAEYQREMVMVLAKRAIAQAVELTGTGPHSSGGQTT